MSLVKIKTIEDAHKEGLITKSEVLEALKINYDINITGSALKYYGTNDLIEPGFNKKFLGTSGTVSLYRKDTPEIIYFIKYLQVLYRYKLTDLIGLFKISKFKNIKKLQSFYTEKHISIIQDQKGKNILRLNDNFKEYTDFQEFIILLALFYLGRIDYSNKTHLQQNIKVKIEKNPDYKILVRIPETDPVTVMFDADGAKILK